MRKFKRHGVVISSQLEADEVRLLQTLLSQLIELMGEEAEPEKAEVNAADPFARWAEELADTGEVSKPEDPALQRLFPDAYSGDPEASAEFRRFTERDQRNKKIADAELAIRHLGDAASNGYQLRIPRADAEAWLRTLGSLRLTLASRLGIDSAQDAEELADLDDDDPRAYLASVYDWLGFAQETLVGAL